MFQLSHPYITTGKTIHLTIWTFASEVMSVLFRMLSKFIIPLLPRSKFLLIACYHITPLYYCCIFFKSALQFSSVAQSCLTLQPHELQHARPPCPSPTPGVHSDSRSSSQWCRISFIIFRKFMSPWQCHHWLIYWLKHYWLIQKFRFLSSLEKLKNPPKYWFYFTARQTLVALMFGTQSAVPINTDLWCLPAERLHVSWNVSLGLHCYSFL